MMNHTLITFFFEDIFKKVKNTTKKQRFLLNDFISLHFEIFKRLTLHNVQCINVIYMGNIHCYFCNMIGCFLCKV